MKFTAEQIAGILNGEIQGNPMVTVSKLSKIEEGEPESLTFLANPKYTKYIYSTNASVAIVNKTFVAEQPVNVTLILVDDAYQAFTQLLEYYNQIKLMKSGIEQPSFIDESAKYGTDIYVGAFAYIGKQVKLGNNVKIYPNTFIGDNVEIGDNCILFPGVKIYSETIIGNFVTIHANTVIGADGFGFAPQDDGSYKKVPQIGNVVIEDYVEIGANSAIDRATLGTTLIKKGVKLDNHIQIAHNVEIGENTVIAALTGVAGSTKIGKNCMIGGQVGIAGHMVIGDNVKVQAQTGIGRNIKDNEVLQGSPAFNYSDFSKSYIHFKNLPKIIKELDELKKQILK